MIHIPVLRKEVLGYLNPKSGENFIDCTVGEGGHSLAILERVLPKGKILGIDWNQKLVDDLKEKIETLGVEKNFIVVCDNFINLDKIVEKYKFGPIKGILFDLGVSSWHLKEGGTGFSFLKNEPLIMRYSLDNRKDLTAKEIVNHWSEKEIIKILKDYGEERFAKRITKEIVEERKEQPIETTFRLSEIIKQATPSWYHHRKIHPATRTFQAIRIAVNDELDNLKKALGRAVEVLEPEGRLVVISFHSLEDRIVKNFFKDNDSLKILTKKVISPSGEEIKANPSSRSAKLRAVNKK